MAEPAADELPPVPYDTTLTDRELLIHALQHLESIDDRLTRFEDMLAGLLEEFGPVLEKARKRYGGSGSRLFRGGQAPGSSPG